MKRIYLNFAFVIHYGAFSLFSDAFYLLHIHMLLKSSLFILASRSMEEQHLKMKYNLC